MLRTTAVFAGTAALGGTRTRHVCAPRTPHTRLVAHAPHAHTQARLGAGRHTQSKPRVCECPQAAVSPSNKLNKPNNMVRARRRLPQPLCAQQSLWRGVPRPLREVTHAPIKRVCSALDARFATYTAAVDLECIHQKPFPRHHLNDASQKFEGRLAERSKASCIGRDLKGRGLSVLEPLPELVCP
jgi:hypothetical protein